MVHDCARIRWAYRDGIAIREIAWRFHHSRRGVREALAHAVPGGYRLTEPRLRPGMIRPAIVRAAMVRLPMVRRPMPVLHNELRAVQPVPRTLFLVWQPLPSVPRPLSWSHARCQAFHTLSLAHPFASGSAPNERFCRPVPGKSAAWLVAGSPAWPNCRFSAAIHRVAVASPSCPIARRIAQPLIRRTLAAAVSSFLAATDTRIPSPLSSTFAILS